MKIVPGTTPLTEPYWQAAKEHKLVLQRCTPCGYVWHPPLPRCPRCHSQALEWQPASGRGKVYSYTTVYHATHAAMTEKVPYIVALVQLEEGPRVLTNLRNCTEEDARVDMPVSLLFEELTDDITLPQFQPARL